MPSTPKTREQRTSAARGRLLKEIGEIAADSGLSIQETVSILCDVAAAWSRMAVEVERSEPVAPKGSLSAAIVPFETASARVPNSCQTPGDPAPKTPNLEGPANAGARDSSSFGDKGV